MFGTGVIEVATSVGMLDLPTIFRFNLDPIDAVKFMVATKKNSSSTVALVMSSFKNLVAWLF